jgi:iron complex outermembrane receptor protein
MSKVESVYKAGADGRKSRDWRSFCALGCRLAALLLLVPWAVPARAQTSDDLSNRSLEDLMNITVTSVAKTEETLSRTASAAFVINAEDIRNSGATNIPDLLRTVPGVDVAQIDSNTWAISIRGFNDRFSNELLVMVDGRTVYTPTFGGVFWDALDLPLEDIERVEVIRGPGGSIWGANATNGVINIITKKASETPKTLVVGGAGNLDKGFGTVQYGGNLGASTSYRIYGKYLNEGQLPDASIGGQNDAWQMFRSGFRLDTAPSLKDSLTFNGDLYSGREGAESPILPSITSGLRLQQMQVDLSGGFIQSIWNHVSSPRSDTNLQVSFDRYSRKNRDVRDTVSIDFQHHYLWAQRQNIVWGVDYRYSANRAGGSLFASLNPAVLGTQMYGFFIQDEIALVKNRLYLTVGTKLEHDYYSGFNLMPSARVAWTVNKRHMLWAALSRAVRTPSRIDTAIRLNFAGFTAADGTPILISLFGNPNFKPEGLTAWELGYRATVGHSLSIDLSTYYNNDSNQQTTEPSTPFFETMPAPPHLVIPTTYENLMHGESYGLEISANWKITDRWILSPGYAFEQIRMRLDPTSQDTVSVGLAEGSSPAHSAQLRSHLVLPHNWAWDASAYFVGRLSDPQVPAYTRVDTGLTWRWREGISVSVVGQNLLQRQHLEFTDENQSVQSALLERSGYAKFTWRF